jgi:hypothetical protein
MLAIEERTKRWEREIGEGGISKFVSYASRKRNGE